MSNTTTTVMPREFAPKRGIPNTTVEILDATIKFKPHHQKDLILELISKNLLTLEAMVKEVESNDEMKARLRSKQSVYNCITYHLKDLKKIGYLNLK